MPTTRTRRSRRWPRRILHRLPPMRPPLLVLTLPLPPCSPLLPLPKTNAPPRWPMRRKLRSRPQLETMSIPPPLPPTLVLSLPSLPPVLLLMPRLLPLQPLPLPPPLLAILPTRPRSRSRPCPDWWQRVLRPTLPLLFPRTSITPPPMPLPVPPAVLRSAPIPGPIQSLGSAILIPTTLTVRMACTASWAMTRICTPLLPAPSTFPLLPCPPLPVTMKMMELERPLELETPQKSKLSWTRMTTQFDWRKMI
mmetsp:Transcript_29536/g.86039  ORF Transcript_29536/g.86039 Transcript_29536/m.86039 type:complete len:251 (-) Transcript_29536:259-1011(-)